MCSPSWSGPGSRPSMANRSRRGNEGGPTKRSGVTEISLLPRILDIGNLLLHNRPAIESVGSHLNLKSTDALLDGLDKDFIPNLGADFNRRQRDELNHLAAIDRRQTIERRRGPFHLQRVG